MGTASDQGPALLCSLNNALQNADPCQGSASRLDSCHLANARPQHPTPSPHTEEAINWGSSLGKQLTLAVAFMLDCCSLAGRHTGAGVCLLVRTAHRLEGASAPVPAVVRSPGAAAAACSSKPHRCTGIRGPSMPRGTIDGGPAVSLEIGRLQLLHSLEVAHIPASALDEASANTTTRATQHRRNARHGKKCPCSCARVRQRRGTSRSAVALSMADLFTETLAK